MERRRHKRFKCEIKVSWRNGEILTDGHTWDISADGVFICTNDIIPPKSIVDMELVFGSENPIRCRGRVAWVNRGQLESFPPGFGVELLDTENRVAERLLTYTFLSYNMPEGELD
jgi:Tfp pilus assembly protein PilZ